MEKSFALLALGALLALDSAPASAQADPDAPGAFRIAIGHADLDLSSSAGQAMLDRRIRAAASEGCAKLYRDPADLELRLGCIARSVAGARREAVLAQAKAKAVRLGSAR